MTSGQIISRCLIMQR